MNKGSWVDILNPKYSLPQSHIGKLRSFEKIVIYTKWNHIVCLQKTGWLKVLLESYISSASVVPTADKSEKWPFPTLGRDFYAWEREKRGKMWFNRTTLPLVFYRKIFLFWAFDYNLIHSCHLISTFNSFCNKISNHLPMHLRSAEKGTTYWSLLSHWVYSLLQMESSPELRKLRGQIGS